MASKIISVQLEKRRDMGVGKEETEEREGEDKEEWEVYGREEGGGKARVGEGKEECNYGRGWKWKGGKEGDIHDGGKGSCGC